MYANASVEITMGEKYNDLTEIIAHALTGRKAEHTLLTGFSGIIDELLRKGIANSAVCYDK